MNGQSGNDSSGVRGVSFMERLVIPGKFALAAYL